MKAILNGPDYNVYVAHDDNGLWYWQARGCGNCLMGWGEGLPSADAAIAEAVYWGWL